MSIGFLRGNTHGNKRYHEYSARKAKEKFDKQHSGDSEEREKRNKEIQIQWFGEKSGNVTGF